MSNEPMPGIAADFMDDARHLKQLLEALGQDPTLNRMHTAVSLLGGGLALVPRPERSHAYANDTSAFACLIRSYRSLRAASTLLLCGYYGEVRHLLRGVYESAPLSDARRKNPS